MTATDRALLASLAGFTAVVYPLALLLATWLRARCAPDDAGSGRWLSR